MSLLEAVRTGLRDEMRRDPLVWALGEDLAVGGIYGQYAGLVDEFGPRRIVSTPISEATMLGAGLGAALVGTRPVIEMRIADFALCGMDELVNQIAKARYMFGGQGRAPLVVRMPQGIDGGSAAQHSQSLESWYVHIPGLVVLAPATPTDARGLLAAAIRCDDPVVFLEARAFWNYEEDVPEDLVPMPIGKAKVVRPGRDITIVTWSASLFPVLAAAEAAAQRGIDVEVVDLRSLWPWDRATVLESVSRTGRILVVQEGVVDAGFGAEIVATVAESLELSKLKALKRIGAPRVPVPYSPPLEDAVKMTSERIVSALNSLMRPSSPDEKLRPDSVCEGAA